jgi:hypothetical protein
MRVYKLQRRASLRIVPRASGKRLYSMPFLVRFNIFRIRPQEPPTPPRVSAAIVRPTCRLNGTLSLFWKPVSRRNTSHLKEPYSCTRRPTRSLGFIRVRTSEHSRIAISSRALRKLVGDYRATCGQTTFVLSRSPSNLWNESHRASALMAAANPHGLARHARY